MENVSNVKNMISKKIKNHQDNLNIVIIVLTISLCVLVKIVKMFYKAPLIKIDLNNYVIVVLKVTQLKKRDLLLAIAIQFQHL